jgi:ABC-type xylose transport system substrate-binding protein
VGAVTLPNHAVHTLHDRILTLLRAHTLLIGEIMTAQDRIAADITKLVSDLAAISDELKTFAANADAATEAALSPLADKLDAVVASADAIAPAVAAIPPATT